MNLLKHSRNSYNYYSIFFFSLLLMLFGLSNTEAQEPSADNTIQMEISVGFKNFVVPESWVPVSVQLENFGPDTSGYIMVYQERGNRFGNIGTPVYSAQIKLPQRTVHLIKFVVPFRFTTYPIRVDFYSDASHDTPLIIKRFQPTATTNRLILVISKRPAFSSLPRQLPTGDAKHVVYPNVTTLPENPTGYDGVDIIVLYDGNLDRITSAQTAAIEKWVISGGTLLFAGTTEQLSMRNSEVFRLSPAIIRGKTLLKESTVTMPALILQNNGGTSFNDGKVIAKKLGNGTVLHSTVDFAHPSVRSTDFMKVQLTPVLEKNNTSERLRIPVTPEMSFQDWHEFIPTDSFRLPDLNFPLLLIFGFSIPFFAALLWYKKSGSFLSYYLLLLLPLFSLYPLYSVGLQQFSRELVFSTVAVISGSASGNDTDHLSKNFLIEEHLQLTSLDTKPEEISTNGLVIMQTDDIDSVFSGHGIFLDTEAWRSRQLYSADFVQFPISAWIDETDTDERVVIDNKSTANITTAIFVSKDIVIPLPDTDSNAKIDISFKQVDETDISALSQKHRQLLQFMEHRLNKVKDPVLLAVLENKGATELFASHSLYHLKEKRHLLFVTLPRRTMNR